MTRLDEALRNLPPQLTSGIEPDEIIEVEAHEVPILEYIGDLLGVLVCIGIFLLLLSALGQIVITPTAARPLWLDWWMR